MKRFLKQHWITILLVALLIILTLTIRGFIFSFEQSYFEGELRAPERRVRVEQKTVAPVAAQKTVQKARASAIQSWMTFDYVSVVYKLPTNYMKDILGINDTRYPNIRIDAYAKQSSIDTNLLLKTVQTYVTNYQNQQ